MNPFKPVMAEVAGGRWLPFLRLGTALGLCGAARPAAGRPTAGRVLTAVMCCALIPFAGVVLVIPAATPPAEAR